MDLQDPYENLYGNFPYHSLYVILWTPNPFTQLP